MKTTTYNTLIDCVVLVALAAGFTVGALMYFGVLVP